MKKELSINQFRALAAQVKDLSAKKRKGYWSFGDEENVDRKRIGILLCQVFEIPTEFDGKLPLIVGLNIIGEKLLTVSICNFPSNIAMRITIGNDSKVLFGCKSVHSFQFDELSEEQILEFELLL